MKKDKLLVQKVILPKFLYKHALDQARKTSSEVGFYIIGLIRGKVAYCYDLIEFDYYEQSAIYLETNFAKDFRLRTGLPIGLDILGNMHRHPGQMLSYSSTDKGTFTRYARDTQNRNVFIIYVVDPDDLRAYTAVEDEVHKIEIEIRNLTQDERLKTFNFTIPINFQVCGPKDSKVNALRYNFISDAPHEVSKCLSRPIFLLDYKEISDDELLMDVPEIEVVPYVPIDVKLGQNYRLAYRFYLPANAKVKDLYDMLIKDFKISPILGLYLDDKELEDGLKLSRIVGKMLNLKEKELLEDIDKYEELEKISKSLKSMKEELKGLTRQDEKSRKVEEELIKIYKFLNDIDRRIAKLEGRDVGGEDKDDEDKNDDKTTKNNFMDYV